MRIELNKSDQRKLVRKLERLEKLSTDDFRILLFRTGFTMAKDIKLPPIPVDTGNLRRNVRFDGKAIRSDAKYSAFIEFGTKFMKAQPFFYKKVNAGIKTFITNVETRIKQLTR